MIVLCYMTNRIRLAAGFGGYLVELFGPSLAQSPAFTRFFLQPQATVQALDIPADAVFVEHFAAGTSAYLEPLMAEGFFMIAFSDLGGLQARSNDFSTYDQVVKAGPNVILTEFLEPALFSNVMSDFSAALPCNNEYCVLPSNFTGPVREPPVITEDTFGDGTLRPVPVAVEPRLTADVETSAGAIHRAALGLLAGSLVALLV